MGSWIDHPLIAISMDSSSMIRSQNITINQVKSVYGLDDGISLTDVPHN